MDESPQNTRRYIFGSPPGSYPSRAPSQRPAHWPGTGLQTEPERQHRSWTAQPALTALPAPGPLPATPASPRASGAGRRPGRLAVRAPSSARMLAAPGMDAVPTLVEAVPADCDANGDGRAVAWRAWLRRHGGGRRLGCRGIALHGRLRNHRRFRRALRRTCLRPAGGAAVSAEERRGLAFFRAGPESGCVLIYSRRRRLLHRAHKAILRLRRLILILSLVGCLPDKRSRIPDIPTGQADSTRSESEPGKAGTSNQSYAHDHLGRAA